MIKSLFRRIDPMINKMVVHFITHGCMAQENEFDFIGKIVGVEYKRGMKFYKIDVFLDKHTNVNESVLAPSWYLHHAKENLYVYFD
jgi:hypothetical protein